MPRLSNEQMQDRDNFILEYFKNTEGGTGAEANKLLKEKTGMAMSPKRIADLRKQAKGGSKKPRAEVTEPMTAVDRAAAMYRSVPKTRDVVEKEPPAEEPAASAVTSEVQEALDKAREALWAAGLKDIEINYTAPVRQRYVG